MPAVVKDQMLINFVSDGKGIVFPAKGPYEVQLVPSEYLTAWVLGVIDYDGLCLRAQGLC